MFDSPIQFTAQSRGVAVRITKTGGLRLKVVPASKAPGVARKKSSTGVASGGTYPNFRISLASGTPSRVNLAQYQVSSSATTNGEYLPDFVYEDLVNNHRWRTGTVTTPHWVAVDLPVAVTIASAQVVYSGIDDSSVSANFKVQHQSGLRWLDVSGSPRRGNTSLEVNVIFSRAVTSDRFRLSSADNTTQRVKEFALFPPNPGTNGVAQGGSIGTGALGDCIPGGCGAV